MKKKSKENNKNKKKMLISIGIVGIIVIGLCMLFAFVILKSGKNPLKSLEASEKEQEKKVQIIDINSKTRNVAVMINNIKSVWGYQSGIQDAYIVYEIIAEGGITRLMGIFKDADTERIGSVRSSRIYYLDYALENDAIYVHIGGSKEALNDIKTLKIADLQSEVTFRDKSLGLNYEHTAFTSMSKINERISKRQIRNTTTTSNLLTYSIDELNLSEYEGAVPANEVYISYSGSKSTTFKYDSENKVYNRFQNDIEHIDYVTKKQYTAKNIITYKIKNSSYDSYGRQKLDNLGSGEGFYISNGYAIPITWKKDSREAQTKYYYLGKELVVNDGNTFIQIQPQNREFSLK